jgi:P27 family predicted phage terminase small subunit
VKRDHPAPDTLLRPPSSLSKEEREAWRQHVLWLRQLGLEAGCDAAVLEGTVRMLCRARAADAVLRTKGLTVEALNVGAPIRRPEATLSLECWKLYAQFAGRFGLSPADRAKLGTAPEPKERAGDVPAHLRDVGRPAPDGAA